jgi:ribosome-binding protein aMBF1 (putative translation factor)
MATGHRRKSLDDLSPEKRAKVEAIRARWHTPEAIEAEIRDREALAEEHRLTGRIATVPLDSEEDSQFRDLASELRAQREKVGLSLAVVSERSGIDQGALSRLENGRGNPTVQTLMRYARAIGGRIAWSFEAS